MQIRIGLENGFENRSVAWALDHPGCFAYGQDATEALLNVPQAVLAYTDWVAGHAAHNWLAELGDFDVRLVEAYEVIYINDRFELSPGGLPVNACFRQDWLPLKAQEAERTGQMLAWSHAELRELADSLNLHSEEEKAPGERWNRLGIVAHVATAKWWLLDRLDLAGMPRSALPKDVLERFEVTHQRLLAVLPELIDRQQVVGKDGELWTPRKLLRRALWHERDHYFHLLKLSL